MRENMIKLDWILSRVHFVSLAPYIAWTIKATSFKNLKSDLAIFCSKIARMRAGG